MLQERGRKPGAARGESCQPELLNLWWHILKSWQFPSRDSLKHTASVSRPDKTCPCFSTNKNTLQCISPEQGFFGGFSSFLFSAQQAGKCTQLWEVLLLGASQSKLPLQTCSLPLSRGFNSVLWRNGKMFSSTRPGEQHPKTFLLFASKFEFETNKNHQFGFVVLKERLSLKLADPKPQPADL